MSEKSIVPYEVRPHKAFVEMMYLWNEVSTLVRETEELKATEAVQAIREVIRARLADVNIMFTSGRKQIAAYQQLQGVRTSFSLLSGRIKALPNAVEICRDIFLQILAIVEPLRSPSPVLEVPLKAEALQTRLQDLEFDLPPTEAKQLQNLLKKYVYKYAGNVLSIDFANRLRVIELQSMGPARTQALIAALQKISIPLGRSLTEGEIQILRKFAEACREEKEPEDLLEEQAAIAKESPSLHNLHDSKNLLALKVRISQIPFWVRMRVEPLRFTPSFLQQWMRLYGQPLHEILGEDTQPEDRALTFGDIIMKDWGYKRMGDFIETYEDELLHVRVRIEDKLVTKLEQRFGASGGQKIIAVIKKEFQEEGYPLKYVLNLAEQKAFKDFQDSKPPRA